MEDQLDGGRHHHVSEVRRHCGALHVAEEMKIGGRTEGLTHCAKIAAEFAEAGVAIAGLDAFKRSAQLRIVGCGLR